MGCSSCGTRKTADGKPSGCNSNGGCSTGGCNRLNTFNWLADMPIGFNKNDNLYEISFNNGSRKDYFRTDGKKFYEKNDWVVVESKTGYDVGSVSLRGELVTLQMKKKKIRTPKEELGRVIRLTNDKDMARWQEAKDKEQESMVKARVIARDLKLNMKIGQVEYQADGKKATFYYIADGRVDFRELIKEYARNFRVKIEMRQIGARQEAGKIGGIGSCGRELCCSTWLNNFKSVSTTAARYQNLAINQSKLSGQCGRLKCCLNYELDSYLDALQHFPKNNEYLKTEAGDARLVKTDIFKGMLWYQYKGEMKLHAIDIERVNEILALNAKKQKPETLLPAIDINAIDIDKEPTLVDGSGMLTLDVLEKTSKRNKRKEQRKRRNTRKKSPNQNNNNPNAQRSNRNKSNSTNKTSNKPKPKPQNKTNQPKQTQGNKSRSNPKTAKPKPQKQNKPNTNKPTNQTKNKPQTNPQKDKQGSKQTPNKTPKPTSDQTTPKAPKAGNKFFKRRKK